MQATRSFALSFTQAAHPSALVFYSGLLGLAQATLRSPAFTLLRLQRVASVRIALHLSFQALGSPPLVALLAPWRHVGS